MATETATMTAATMTMNMKATAERQRQLGGSCGSAAVAAAARRWLRNRIKGTPISLFSETHHVCPLQILLLSPQGLW